MTKAELIKALKNYSDDEEVMITYECDNDYRTLDEVKHNGNFIIIESKQIPEDDGIVRMAQACYKKYSDTMNIKLKNLYEDFINEGQNK